MVTLSRFQRHMMFFAKPGTSKVTLLSAIKSSLSLGLDFPVACFLSIGLRLTYANFPWLSPVDVHSIPSSQFRTQLEDVPLNQGHYSRSDLVNLYYQSESRGGIAGLYDYLHVNSFWMIAADTKTHLVDANTVKAFQEGEWEEGVVKRRKSRRRDVGEVLPLWRGGPISVTGHSWFVSKLFGVRVYEP